MKCPKCDGEMEVISHEGVEVDRCTSCSGIWFDVMEAEELIESGDADVIDTGSAVKGWVKNFIKDISCPRCQTQMETVSDAEQSIVKFEVCPKCHGSFMDAGEFRDLAKFNLAEAASERIIAATRQCASIFKAMHLDEK